MLTFDGLCKIEPRLVDIHKQAIGARQRRLDALKRASLWYSRLKPEMSRLVGWRSTRPELQSGLAYDVAYFAIYGTLFDIPKGRHQRKSFIGL